MSTRGWQTREGSSPNLRVRLENAAYATRTQHELDGCLPHLTGQSESSETAFCMFPSSDPLRVKKKKKKSLPTKTKVKQNDKNVAEGIHGPTPWAPFSSLKTDQATPSISLGGWLECRKLIFRNSNKQQRLRQN